MASGGGCLQFVEIFGRDTILQEYVTLIIPLVRLLKTDD